MKKTLIAGAGVAAFGLAVLPLAGVFADVTDTVTITINGACSVGGETATTGAGKTFTETMTNGSLKAWDATESTGGKLVVSCNDSTGWNIKAVGAGSGSDITAMAGSVTGTSIPTGTNTSGTPSSWAFKVAGDNTVAAYQSYSAVPGTATKVAGNNAPVSAGVIYTGYQVWVSATQQAGSYTGRVTYTVAPGA